ncbi:MAG: 4Fe-4S dicluster domain-containing protein [Tepidiformaceae bacterium]
MKGILKGLATTLSVAMRRPVTIEYPDEKHALPLRQRSFPILTWDFEHDEPFCTGCMVCVRNCPVDCMSAVMQDNPKYATGESNRRKIIEKFWIDYGRCMRCNICVEVCNFEAIVMDNTWQGFERSSYDRRDLHLDLDDLLQQSRAGDLPRPYHPADDLDANIALSEGKEVPVARMQGARPEARAAALERVAQGLPAGIKEREVEAPKVAATTTAAGAAPGAQAEEVLSESKIRAKRMRAERQAKEYTDRGEPVPQEVSDTIALYRAMKPGQTPAAAAAATAGSATAAAPAGAPLTGRNAAGTMRFPPGVGTGEKGDPNSPEKVRARRMRAERKHAELTTAGEPIPDDIAATLHETGSDLAPGGGIWATLAPSPAPAASAGPAVAPAAAAPQGGAMVFPPGIGTGPKGDPNSHEKVRARRMRAERKAKEVLAAGEPIPADVMATLTELGSPMASGELPPTPAPPQPHTTVDPRAAEAAAAGELPPPAPRAAGESARGEPSRAEVMSMNPATANEPPANPATPTSPDAPPSGEPQVEGRPTAGRTETPETAPPSESAG